MKAITTALKLHLKEGVTTVATFIMMTRRDGTTFCLTDHDMPVLVDTQTYTPINSFSRSSIQTTSELEVDQMEIHGILNSTAVARDDVASGMFDFAQCTVFLANYVNPEIGKLVSRVGWLGEVVLNEDGTFQAELRGLTQVFTYRLGTAYAPECSADLGDKQCKIGLSPPVWQPKTAYRIGDTILAPIDAATGFINAALVNSSYETQASNSVIRTPTGWTTYGPGNGRWNFRTSITGGSFGANLTSASDATILAAISEVSGTHDTTELGMYQDYDLLGGGMTEVDLDTGLCRAVFNYRAGLVHKDGRVRGRLLAIDADGVVTGTIYDSGLNSYAVNRWFRVNANVILPDGTRKLRVDLYCQKAAAISHGGVIDGVFLSINTPEGTLGSAGQYGGVMFQALKSGTTGTTMPAFTNVLATEYTDATQTWKCITSFKEVDVVAAVTAGNKIFEVTSLANPAGHYDGGLLIWETGRNAGRAVDVKSYDGTDIELFLRSFYPIEVGDRYVIHPGCDKRLGTCVTKFNNVINFRGYPHVPGQDAYMASPDAPARD